MSRTAYCYLVMVIVGPECASRWQPFNISMPAIVDIGLGSGLGEPYHPHGHCVL